MITRLEELTMQQFIDLCCGDYDILCHKHEIVDEEILAKTARDIIVEYKSITDEQSMRRYILDAGERLKANIAVVLWGMCRNLISFGEYGNIREIMKEAGINADRMSDERVTAEVLSRLAAAERKLSEYNNHEEDVTDIRRNFDKLTAVMMSHFKFQIDPTSMRATHYAHLLARFGEEVKMQSKILKKR